MYIHICIDCRQILGEDPEIQWETEYVRKMKRQRKEQRKKQPGSCWPHKRTVLFFFSQGYLMKPTAMLNLAYSIATIKTSVLRFILTNDGMDLCWIKRHLAHLHWTCTDRLWAVPIIQMSLHNIIFCSTLEKILRETWNIHLLNGCNKTAEIKEKRSTITFLFNGLQSA